MKKAKSKPSRPPRKKSKGRPTPREPYPTTEEMMSYALDLIAKRHPEVASEARQRLLGPSPRG